MSPISTIQYWGISSFRLSCICMIQYWGISSSRLSSICTIQYWVIHKRIYRLIHTEYYSGESARVLQFYLYDTDLREHIGVRHLLHIYGRQILASFYSIVLWISLYLNVVSKGSSCRATLYKMKLAKLYQKQFNMYAELLQEFCMEYDLI